MGTRFSPRTCRVRPVASTVFTAASFCSPPSAWRVAAEHGSGGIGRRCLGGQANDETPRAPARKDNFSLRSSRLRVPREREA